MARFLGLFESILTPIEWNVENFDLFLNPATAPVGFIPWLAQWFDITFESAWTESQRRTLLKDAHLIYARRGTRWALSRVIEILTGYKPTIIDDGNDLPDFTFKVILPLVASQVNREMIERLIDAHKPAHTMYSLEFQP
jgi:phage tail-like protein